MTNTHLKLSMSPKEFLAFPLKTSLWSYFVSTQILLAPSSASDPFSLSPSLWSVEIFRISLLHYCLSMWTWCQYLIARDSLILLCSIFLYNIYEHFIYKGPSKTLWKMNFKRYIYFSALFRWENRCCRSQRTLLSFPEWNHYNLYFCVWCLSLSVSLFCLFKNLRQGERERKHSHLPVHYPVAYSGRALVWLKP